MLTCTRIATLLSLLLIQVSVAQGQESDTAAYRVTVRLAQVLDAAPAQFEEGAELTLTHTEVHTESAAFEQVTGPNPEDLKGLDVAGTARKSSSGKLPTYLMHEDSTMAFPNGKRVDTRRLGTHDGVRIITAPQLVVLSDTPASISVASAVQYMSPVGDDLYRAAESVESEGVEMSLRVMRSEKDPAHIRVQDLRIDVRHAVSRVPLPDLAIDAGPPVMQRTTIRTSIELSPGQIACIPLTLAGDESDPIFAFLEVSEAEL